MRPRDWQVSSLTNQTALEQNEKYKNFSCRREFTDLMAAVDKALRGVEFHRLSPNTAVVYRKGDIFALGEVGFKNTKSKGNGELTYYVQSRRIKNDKYREGSWQHHIVSTKSLANAAKAAATYLVPFTCEEGARATCDLARQMVSDKVGKYQSVVRDAFRELTGEVGYASNMSSPFMMELRSHKFTSPALNAASEKFYAAHDAWKDVEAASKAPLYYVGVCENYGQHVVDTARVEIGYPCKIEAFERMPADSVADWVRGRVAVLSMVEPMSYVAGVGLRMDDKIFYVLGEKE